MHEEEAGDNHVLRGEGRSVDDDGLFEHVDHRNIESLVVYLRCSMRTKKVLRGCLPKLKKVTF